MPKDRNVNIIEDTDGKKIVVIHDIKFKGKRSIYDAKGDIERYNVFHASMIIRHSEDGKFYLYDIIDIKKETSNPLGS